METILTIIFFIAIAVYLLVRSAPVQEVARWAAGVSALLIALLAIV